METNHPRVTRTPGVCGGKACVAGHRIRVSDVALWHEHEGLNPDEIVSQYPSLSLADVHSALAYYYDHIEEIRQEMREDTELAERLRDNAPSLLAEKIRSTRRVS